jgi:hypothetical protein
VLVVVEGTIVVWWAQMVLGYVLVFQTSASDFKSHMEKKANMKPRHAYLGTDSGKKNAGWTSWCMPVKVFGGMEAQLSALGLDGPQLGQFGEALARLSSDR